MKYKLDSQYTLYVAGIKCESKFELLGNGYFEFSCVNKDAGLNEKFRDIILQAFQAKASLRIVVKDIEDNIKYDKYVEIPEYTYESFGINLGTYHIKFREIKELKYYYVYSICRYATFDKIYIEKQLEYDQYLTYMLGDTGDKRYHILNNKDIIFDENTISKIDTYQQTIHEINKHEDIIYSLKQKIDVTRDEIFKDIRESNK